MERKCLKACGLQWPFMDRFRILAADVASPGYSREAATSERIRYCSHVATATASAAELVAGRLTGLVNKDSCEVKREKGLDVTVKFKAKSSPFPSTEMSPDLFIM